MMAEKVALTLTRTLAQLDPVRALALTHAFPSPLLSSVLLSSPLLSSPLLSPLASP